MKGNAYDQKNVYEAIYLFLCFFLLLTLSLFFVMNRLSSKTLEENLISASKNQLDYVKGILDGIIYEANMYGVQYAADSDVRFYQRHVIELSNYDSQMKKTISLIACGKRSYPVDRLNRSAFTGSLKKRFCPPTVRRRRDFRSRMFINGDGKSSAIAYITLPSTLTSKNPDKMNLLSTWLV